MLSAAEFVAVRGAGATLNEAPITVSKCTELRRALVSTGFSYDHQTRAAEYTRPFTAVLKVTREFAATVLPLDLAWVACGRFDGHWEFNLSPWDVAAGFLLVREAGGTVGSMVPPTTVPSRRRHRELLLRCTRWWRALSSRCWWTLAVHRAREAMGNEQ